MGQKYYNWQHSASCTFPQFVESNDIRETDDEIGTQKPLYDRLLSDFQSDKLFGTKPFTEILTSVDINVKDFLRALNLVFICNLKECQPHRNAEEGKFLNILLLNSFFSSVVPSEGTTEPFILNYPTSTCGEFPT
jgi:hypothetical protein